MGTLGPLLELEGYDVRYASSKPRKLMRLLDMLMSVFKHQKKVDVVLIDTYSTQNFYYALLVSQLCRLLKLSYIPILHGGNLPNRLKSHPRLSRWIFNHSTINVAPSSYLKEQFEAHGFRNIKYIPNTIDIVNYPFKTRDYVAPRLLWVRSFVQLYHPKMAVAVLKSLDTLGFKATLCMVGPDADGSMKEVKQLAEELNVHVIFTGKLLKQEWISLSEDYNFFINTTNVDNTPVSVIEAMALGLPIVSTNVGGMPFLITHGETGLLVEKGNVDAMVAAIVWLFKQTQEREQLIFKARELAETFDWQRVKMQWNEILHR